MSNFEKLVEKMRAAQNTYNEKPTAENLNTVEDLEDEVDSYLNFVKNCHATTSQGVKKWVASA